LVLVSRRHWLAPDLQRLLAPGGWLGLSGISPAQISLLAAAFPTLELSETCQFEDWSAVILSS